MRKILTAIICLAVVFTFCACTADKDFSYVYPWAKDLKAEDIDEIRMEKGSYGVSPAVFKNICYSTDEKDIKSVCDLFRQPIKRTKNEGLCGGGYFEYTVSAQGKNYSFKIEYGSVIKTDGNHQWELVSFDLPQINNPYLTSHLLKIPETCTVFSDKEAEHAIGFFLTSGSMEFTESEKKYSDSDVKFYIDLNINIKLGVVDKKIFICGEETYKMLSDLDLTEINYY